jgi:hypothetical protein
LAALLSRKKASSDKLPRSRRWQREKDKTASLAYGPPLHRVPLAAKSSFFEQSEWNPEKRSRVLGADAIASTMARERNPQRIFWQCSSGFIHTVAGCIPTNSAYRHFST